MANEQYTENMVLNEMKVQLGQNDFGYVFPQGDVDEVTKIEALLKEAGGKPVECGLPDYTLGGKGKAKPEFIVTYNDDVNTIIVVECKKTTKNHYSTDYNQPRKFAIDGVLYYAKFLKKEFNVIAIAVSGTKKETSLVSTYYWPKNSDTFSELLKARNIILEPQNYIKLIKGEKLIKNYSIKEIRDTALEMHNTLRQIKVSERHKPIFIAGILIALENDEFNKEYSSSTSFSSLIKKLNSAIDDVLVNSDIKRDKIENVKSAFKIIGRNEKLKAIPLGHKNSITWYIEQLEMKIKPMMNHTESSLDALSIFYHEFVKYSGGDGKGLGIVLTPQHLTDFMAMLAGVNKNSRVVDITCGSGSFLVTSMSMMFKDANPSEMNKIRKDGLYGVELDNDLYTLAIANMIIRKDGKSNIYHGDCFNKTIMRELKSKNIDVGLINPPYSQDDKSELEFVENMLDILVNGGSGVAVVPMSCAIGTKFKAERERLFRKHTLQAVFSMPSEIFHPTGTNVCVMVWKAHHPHKKGFNTFFGYYKNDGFVKKKKLGRIDYYNKWNEILLEWLYLYENRKVVKGKTAVKSVTHSDEWLVEAYMETDYEKLTKEDFEVSVKEYVSYLVKSDKLADVQDLKLRDVSNENLVVIDLDTSDWKYFDIGNQNGLFKVVGTKTTSIDDLEDFGYGIYPYVTTRAENCGVSGFYNYKTEDGNVIVIDSAVLGFATYQSMDFSASDHVEKLIPKFELNKYIGIFIVTILNKETYKYSYGRKANQKKINDTKIKLPVAKDGTPNYDFMEKYIKNLKYSKML